MTTDYSSFLAARVLNDNKLITYRLLSRELKVHANKAKEYLASFYESENQKRKGSCHATYLVTGVPKPLIPSTRPKTDKDHDTYMESSPVPEPVQNEGEEDIKTSSVILVSEEQLEEVKDSLEEVTSVHVYSIQPGPLKDLVAISDASTELYSRFPALGAVEMSKLYGITLNKYAKKREGAPPPPPPPESTKSSTYVVPVKKDPLPAATSTPSTASAPKEIKREGKKDFFGSIRTRDTQKQSQSSEPASSAKAKVPLKRGQSDLMASFSNAQPKKAKQPEKEKTPPPSDFMDVDDDDAGEEEPVDEEAAAAEKARQEEIRRKREENEEELRRMMEEDDDEPIPAEPNKTSSATAGSPEETTETPTEEPEEPAPSAPAPGRRKAKRKVTKKVRSKDENGYIVTREVTEWEEFSEDDVPPPVKPAAKPNAFSAMKQAPSSQKGKKGASEGAPKRDIASFFQKK